MKTFQNCLDTLAARINEENHFIQVLLGPRQVGKTTALQRLLSNYAGPSLYTTNRN